MVHAQLFPGDENSGRLVALLRRTARDLARDRNKNLILADGPPGIGCPVISSLSGTDLVIIVTEPTISGHHDLERVAGLCSHFKIPAGVIINKYDINKDLSGQIESYCRKEDLIVMGKIPHDASMTEAMVRGQVIFEYQNSSLTENIRSIWDMILHAAAAAVNRT
jgi:MinD superfamily P-loop ATPase